MVVSKLSTKCIYNVYYIGLENKKILTIKFEEDTAMMVNSAVSKNKNTLSTYKYFDINNSGKSDLLMAFDGGDLEFYI